MKRSRHNRIHGICCNNKYRRHYELDVRMRSARLYILLFFFSCAALCIFARIVWLQGVDQQRWMQLAQRQYRGKMSILGARGSIMDRSGRTIATSAQTLAVGIHPARFRDKEASAKAFAEILGITPETAKKKLGSSKNFVWLKKGVRSELRPALQNISRRGVSINSEFTRFYPHGRIAGSLIGKVGYDGDGLSGIELAFNQRLRAEPQTHAVRRDARGNYYRPISLTQSGEAAAKVRAVGNDVVLSIDVVLQDILEREVARGRLNAEAKAVYAALMNADTGEILGMAEDKAVPAGNSQLERLRNGVLQNAYEPGSTFKPLVAAIALDAGVVNPKQLLGCQKGRMRVGRHTIRDIHPIKGDIRLRDVLVQSSNVCMAQLGQKLGKEKLHSAITSLGFGSKTGIELRGEASGILRGPRRWREIDVATISFGQGIAATALQVLRAYGALANGGYLVTPTILAQAQAPQRQRVLSEASVERISDMIAGVVQDEKGTARRARISGVTVYGKTGTAQKPSKNSRGYDPDAVLSSFVGYIDGNSLGIPARLVLYVAVDEPQVSPRWGGTVAAPVFKRAMERVLSHLITTQSTIAFRSDSTDERLASGNGAAFDVRMQSVS